MIEEKEASEMEVNFFMNWTKIHIRFMDAGDMR